MKTRVLFVDDEPLILQGLQRMLRSQRHEWDMTFVESGDEAMARMDQQSFDVVVSDMRMPGMDGASLLNRVRERHPETLRFILSGHADQDMVMRCVGSTHQFLSKPCDPDALRTTIERARRLAGTLHGDALGRLVGRLEHLPSLPSLYVEIVDRLRDPEVCTDDVAAVVAKDVAMTAKMLKLVNSAFFGLGRPIASPAEAVSYLGIETIKSLVLTMHAFAQYEGTSVPAEFMGQLWSHSLEVAGAARTIAGAEAAGRHIEEEAFGAGMLHDVGKLILMCNVPDECALARRLAEQESIALWEAETRVLGASHADVGGYLLGLWGLPAPVVEAIALHHAPQSSPTRAFGPLAAVHAANLLAKPVNGVAAMLRGNLDSEYLEAIGCAARAGHWRAVLQNPAPRNHP
ncbi:MAG: HDOD domain-containing protein [Verrucomicrobiae bacterium]|nr:HDOD domain-containing protein [Verrucomicrobiae bacterium]